MQTRFIERLLFLKQRTGLTLKQLFVTWERRTWIEPLCAKCIKKAFESRFIAGYVECFTEGNSDRWNRAGLSPRRSCGWRRRTRSD